jgi:hypothetical protein
MRNLRILPLALIAAALLWGQAGADSVAFAGGDDNAIVWPQWWTKIQTDLHGTPDFASFDVGPFKTLEAWGAEFLLTDDDKAYLQKVTFSYISPNYDNLVPTLFAGDLFIDTYGGTNPDGWDYAVNLGLSGDTQRQTGGSGFAVLKYSDLTYNDNPAADPYGNNSAIYYQAGASNFRQYHPWALTRVGVSMGTDTGLDADFDGWLNDTGEKFSGTLNPPGGPSYSVTNETVYQSTFDLTAGGQQLGLELTERNFSLGFTINCANDVVYGRGPVPQEDIPEPTTLVLLGTGLLGMVAARRRNAV